MEYDRFLIDDESFARGQAFWRELFSSIGERLDWTEGVVVPPGSGLHYNEGLSLQDREVLDQLSKSLSRQVQLFQQETEGREGSLTCYDTVVSSDMSSTDSDVTVVVLTIRPDAMSVAELKRALRLIKDPTLGNDELLNALGNSVRYP